MAYESLNTTFKGGEQRGADDLVGTGADNADSQDPDVMVCEREKAL